MSWTTFFALVRKDLWLFFRDRRSVIMSFIAPILIASFFGYTLGGGGSANRKAAKIPVFVADDDLSETSREIVKRLAEDDSLAVTEGPAEAAREEVRHGKARVAAIIPQGFGESAAKAFFRSGGEKPAVRTLFDPSRIGERQMIEGLLTRHVMESVSKGVFSGKIGGNVVNDALRDVDASGMGAADKSALKRLLEGVREWQTRDTTAGAGGGGSSGGLSVPFELKSEEVTAREGQKYNAFAHSFAGMGVQFILFMGIEAGVSVLMQKQLGLWKRLRSAPVSRMTLLGSRAASAAICALIILFVMFGVGWLAFGVRIEGSVAGFVGVGVAFAAMTATFGLLIASLGKTPEAVRPLAVMATLIMVMLGGSWVPTFVFPQWLQTATLVVPTRWAVDGLSGMTWRGLGFDAALPCIGVMLGFAVLFGALAVTRFRLDSE